MSEWIDVREYLPPSYSDVLVIDCHNLIQGEVPEVWIGYYNQIGKKWIVPVGQPDTGYNDEPAITHWMKMPETPDYNAVKEWLLKGLEK